MPRRIRVLVFALVLMLGLPLIVLYIVLYTGIMLVAYRRSGISGTTYEPFTVRLLMHDLGTREDGATARLARALPATAPWLWWLISGPMRLATRLSGFTPLLLRFPVRRPPGMAALLTLRTAFIDEAMREALPRVAQVVVLGAGWDTRLYALPAGTSVRCFEVDTSPTSQAKQVALAKAGIDARHVTFVAADFNRQSWLDALVAQGFDPALPTFVLWEGVSMYLEPQAVADTLAAVAGLAPGSRIAFDYLAAELVAHDPPFRLIGWYMTAGIASTFGEHIIFGWPMLPEPRAGAAAAVREAGLALERWDAAPQAGWLKTPFYGFVLAESHGPKDADHQSARGGTGAEK